MGWRGPHPLLPLRPVDTTPRDALEESCDQGDPEARIHEPWNDAHRMLESSHLDLNYTRSRASSMSVQRLRRSCADFFATTRDEYAWVTTVGGSGQRG